MKEKKDDYVVLFQGVKLSKHEANSVGLGLIFGIIGMFVSLYIPIEVKFVNYLVIAIFCIGGYCLGNRFFKKQKRNVTE